MSEHPATAALEILVHVKRSQLLRDDYSLITAQVPDEFVVTLDVAALKRGWDAPIETTNSTSVGDAWFDERVSLGLRVPSAILRGQYNVLLNPLHEAWAKVSLAELEPFLFDSRLAQ